MESFEWFSNSPEIIDHTLQAKDAAVLLQEMTFDDWHGGECDIKLMDASDVDDEITYWRDEKAAGESYYGNEHEGRSKNLSNGNLEL
ncbi:hypothetical protein [Xanthomonas vasicola]|nr:hypothetical protein [Xanthomonas vasicola]